MRRFIPLSLFGFTFGLVEAAVVVYLRWLYYPEGFDFPLKDFSMEMIRVEIPREAATLLMMAAVAWAVGSSWIQRFSYFWFIFGVWDVAYYFWLWVFLGWPESLFTPDILFLIPVPWVGPVLSPVIVSAAFMLSACLLVLKEHAGGKPRIDSVAWILGIVGALIVLWSYVENWELAATGEMPGRYRWELLAAGLAFWTVSLRRILSRA